jgi:hypothetical protein
MYLFSPTFCWEWWSRSLEAKALFGVLVCPAWFPQRKRMLIHKTLSGSSPNNEQMMSEKVVFTLRRTEMKWGSLFHGDPHIVSVQHLPLTYDDLNRAPNKNENVGQKRGESSNMYFLYLSVTIRTIMYTRHNVSLK